MASSGGSELPRDAIVIKKILESMGVQDYEPRVVQQLMEFMYRYTSEVLQDAELYAEHAGKPVGEVALDDVKLAIKSRVSFQFTKPPERSELLELARVRNKVPLPEVPTKPGLHLPSDTSTLIMPNWQLAGLKRQREK